MWPPVHVVVCVAPQALGLVESFPDVLAASRENLDDISAEIGTLSKEVAAIGSLVKDFTARRGRHHPRVRAAREGARVLVWLPA